MKQPCNWCNLGLMDLNAIRVCQTSSTCASYYFNNAQFNSASSYRYRYLGVHITSSLTWSIHISNIINNANRMFGYLHHNFSTSPTSLKLLLYKNLVRSKLEYAASVWHLSTVNLMKALELVQNSARFILHNYHQTGSVTATKNTLQVTSLSSRCKFSRLCLFHKIFHNKVHPRANLWLSPSYLSSRIDRSHKVGIPTSHKIACSEYSVPGTSKEWNHPFLHCTS